MNKISIKKDIVKLLMSVMAVFAFTACVSDNDSPGEEDEPQGEVTEGTTLAELTEDLEAASAASKKVKNIMPSTASEKGWVILFDDNSKITVTGTNNVKAPLLNVNSKGNWQVSYDTGASFEELTYTSGAVVSTIDKDTSESVGVRYQTTRHGRYLFEVYHLSNPSKIVSRVESKKSSSPTAALFGMSFDELSGVATIITCDLKTYTFALSSLTLRSASVSPSTISIRPSSTVDVMLNVVPVSMTVDINGGSDACGIELLDKNGRPSNNLVIESLTAVSGSLGNYTLTLKDLGKSKEYEEEVYVRVSAPDGSSAKSNAFTVYCNDGNNLVSFSANSVDAVRVSSTVWTLKLPYGNSVSSVKVTFKVSEGSTLNVDGKPLTSGTSTVKFDRPLKVVVSNGGQNPDVSYVIYPHYSKLPMVYMQSPSDITSKDQWVKKCELQIGNAGNYNIELEKVQLRGRGNSTWAYPKKPYAIKFDKRTSIMGMPEHKRWVLLANWLDKTVMRNGIAFEVARRLPGMEWTPRGTWVEVMLNGRFLGNYYLCEQIRVDENRVDIDEMDPSNISGEALTGGYLVELDTYFDEPYKFRTAVKGLPVNLKSPDENVPNAQMKYIDNYFEKVENILYKNGSGDIWKHIDMDSFIDWWIVNEVARNWEPNHPKSSYMHKKRSGLLYAGPVWDYDWATFQSVQSEPTSGPLIIRNGIWYDRLFGYPEFVSRVKERWAKYKPVLESIPEDFIDPTYELIRESGEANAKQWPISQGVNSDYRMSFGEAVSALRSFYVNRIKEMDRAIKAL